MHRAQAAASCLVLTLTAASTAAPDWRSPAKSHWRYVSASLPPIMYMASWSRCACATASCELHAQVHLKSYHMRCLARRRLLACAPGALNEVLHAVIITTGSPQNALISAFHPALQATSGTRGGRCPWSL